MGVHGLATYLRENKRLVASSLEFGLGNDETVVVIDGFSFIYKLASDSQLPWVYGGEYPRFGALVRRVVEGWLQCGLNVHFVFDGPIRPEKFTTSVGRLVRTPVQNSLLYFRTSPIARSNPRFLNSSRLPPPLMFDACVNTLQAIDGVGLHFADDEGDPYAVELAGQLCGYVAGQDSDFAVLNSCGYRGYIPLDEMLWTEVGSQSESSVADPDDDFQVVRKPKRKMTVPVVVSPNKQTVGRGIVPPELSSNLSLHVSVYEPSTLAQHFKIPTSLLPLLGALVGNDYTPPSHNSLLFKRGLSVSQRIAHAANTLHNLLHPKVSPHKKPHAPQSVLQLIEMTIERLVNSSYAPTNMIGSAAQAEIVNQVVDATLPYAIRSVKVDDVEPTLCNLHPPDDCPLFFALSSLRNPENPHHVEITSRYLAAFRSGKLAPKIMNVFTTATYWPRLFLEDPDVESTPRSISRHVRVIIYAILEDALGIPAAERDDDGIDTEADFDADERAESPPVVDDPDEELIGVEDSEEEQDDVEHLRDALRDLSFDNDDPEEDDEGLDGGTSVAASHPSERSNVSFAYSRRSNGPKVVSEYVRKGTRVIAEEIPVPSAIPGISPSSSHVPDMESPLPLPLQSEDDRFSAFLTVLKSDTPLIRALNPQHLLAVLTLRTIICRLSERAQDAPSSKEKQREKWSRNEANVFLSAFSDDLPSIESSYDAEDLDLPLVSTRDIQLVAQAFTTIEAIACLSQVLFLADRVPNCALRFSGQRFHALLADGAKAMPEHVALPAVLEGLAESSFLDIPGRKGERKKQRDLTAHVETGSKKGPKGASSKSIYALLGEATL